LSVEALTAKFLQFHLGFRKQLNLEQQAHVVLPEGDGDGPDLDDEGFSDSDRKHYGPYLPSRRYNGDEVPLTASEDNQDTLADVGDHVVNLPLGGRRPGRIATLIPLLRASGTQPKKIHIILRGTGKRIKKERPTWHPDVVVHFSKKGYLNGTLWEQMTKQFEIKKNSVVFLDQVSQHRDLDIRKWWLSQGILAWLFPSRCTDYLQPIDCAIGNLFLS